MEDTTMKINFNRLSVLAGLPVQKSSLREGKGHEDVEEMRHDETMDEMMSDMSEEEETDEMKYEMADDEMIEVDEAMLVQELRRAKRLVQENKRRKQRGQRNKQQIFEGQLKKIIDEEVKNVLQDMNLNSGWVYGNRRPTRSRRGYTHQGSFLPGLGFRK